MDKSVRYPVGGILLILFLLTISGYAAVHYSYSEQIMGGVHITTFELELRVLGLYTGLNYYLISTPRVTFALLILVVWFFLSRHSDNF